MKREVDVERARIAWNFLQLPYVKRAALLVEFGLPAREPHTEILPECLDKLKSAGRLEEFGERVKQARGNDTTDTGGVCGLFANTYGARVERGEVPAEIVAAGERIEELRKAAEPLRAYLAKYGDPYTVVVVRQDCATETQEGRYVTFEGVQ